LYGKKRLADLLKSLSDISGSNWIRLLYCHPANLDKDVIKTIMDNKNICRYIDLPLEHINDRILRRMGRSIKKSDIILLIEYIRKTIPDVALRTSFIVGFPGEKEKDFNELVSFIKETKFERLGLFKYSKEERTPAYKFKGDISEKEQERRFSEIMKLQEVISTKVNERFKGKILKVLLDEKLEDGSYIARSEYDAPEVDGVVYIKGKDLSLGNFYDVRIIDTYEYDVVGEVV
jgi:ribosomal protein S12 methylthiotransferase